MVVLLHVITVLLFGVGPAGWCFLFSAVNVQRFHFNLKSALLSLSHVAILLYSIRVCVSPFADF